MAAAAFALLLAPGAAAAQTAAAETAPPAGFLGGLAAGVGHPINGFGHLAVILAIAVLATVWRSGPVAPAAFLFTSLAGCLLVVGGTVMPMAEPGVGLSALFIGGLCLARMRLGFTSFLLLASAAGLVHGTVYGGAIAGAEPAAIGGYLLALAFVQVAMMTLAALAAARLLRRPATGGGELRLAGAAFAALGAACLALAT